jgi:glycosyltransferase involved in cell wall biosynthesis
MFTTFFGAQSFGGDAAYVGRLAGALARAGHHVEVVHCADAFRAVSAGRSPRPGSPPPHGVTVHTLRSRLGRLSPLWTHQTGGLGPKARPLDGILRDGRFDVVHLHNVSLAGAAGLLELAGRESGAVKLLSVHEHWLVCPLSTLWRHDGTTCERPRCLTCTVRSGRPPQLWRRGGRLERAVAGMDAVICPSEHTRRLHEERGVAGRLEVLPYFLPTGWGAGADGAGWSREGRPYVAAAGRLVPEKGFDELVAAMGDVPEVDLVLAGRGPAEAALRRQAAGMANVRLAGMLGEERIAGLLAGARGAVVPSRFWETFGYVVLEAAAVGTPALVRERGPLGDLAARTGGVVFRTRDELAAGIRRLAHDEAERRERAATARRAVATAFSEHTHVRRYEALVAALAGADGALGPPARREPRPRPVSRRPGGSAPARRGSPRRRP